MKITIVTAFFDIGRGEFGYLGRSNDKYFEYFKFWARIQNDLIVYCQSSNARQIMKIRAQFGLADKTKICVIDDIFSIEKTTYDKMKEIENNRKFHNFRYSKKALSNCADYDYIMYMKWWCLKDAASRLDSRHMVAWLDFGYNHGGVYYTDPKDFNFIWEYDFEDKINIFCLSDPNKACAIDYLQFQADCCIGCPAVMTASNSIKFWSYIKESMRALLSLDCIDDDQMLILMAYKLHSTDFSFRICDWFRAVELCSKIKFHTNNKKNTRSPKQIIKFWFERLKTKYSFIERSKVRERIYWK